MSATIRVFEPALRCSTGVCGPSVDPSSPASRSQSEPAARVDLLHENIRKFGTITNTLGAACELTGEIESLSSGGAT